MIVSSPYKVADRVSVGSIVEYSDVANPRATYVVISINRNDPWSPFLLRNIDPNSGYSCESTDLAQAGWEFILA